MNMRRFLSLSLIAFTLQCQFGIAVAETAATPDKVLLGCAEAGQMICQLDLGKAYAFGDEAPEDLEKALYWLNQKPSKDFGYGPNIQALLLVDAIEKYKATGNRKDLDVLRKEHTNPHVREVDKEVPVNLEGRIRSSEPEGIKQKADASPPPNTLPSATAIAQNEQPIPEITGASTAYADPSPVLTSLGLSLIIGLLFTWGIGLAPAFIARYAIYKRPLSKKAANWIAATSCVAFAFIATALHAEEGSRANIAVWIFVFFVSRWIMTRGDKNVLSQKPTASVTLRTPSFLWKSPAVRVFVAAQIVWLVLLLFSNSLTFQYVFDFYYYDEDRFAALAILPPTFILISLILGRWAWASFKKTDPTAR